MAAANVQHDNINLIQAVARIELKSR
jgi:hypothetical protein